MRVNCGGDVYVDTGGNTWEADRAYSSSAGYGYVGTTTGTYTVSNDISDTEDDPLYQTERNGMTQYKFKVPNGTYQVTLKFSENRFKAAGKRTFDVKLEGKKVLSSFDIFAAAGGARYTAVDRTFTVTVSDETLNVAFVAIVDKPKVNAIEVIQQ